MVQSLPRSTSPVPVDIALQIGARFLKRTDLSHVVTAKSGIDWVGPALVPDGEQLPLTRHNPPRVVNSKALDSILRRIRWVRCLVRRSCAGILSISTALVQTEIAIKDIRLNYLIFDAGGIGRRMPDMNPHKVVRLEGTIELDGQREMLSTFA